MVPLLPPPLTLAFSNSHQYAFYFWFVLFCVCGACVAPFFFWGGGAGRFDAILASVLRSKWGYSVAPGGLYTTLGQGKSAPGAAGRLLERLEPAELLKVCAQGLTFFEREEKDLGLLLFPQVGRAKSNQLDFSK